MTTTAVADRPVLTTTRTERDRRVADGLHSWEMEGLSVDAAGRADAEEYVNGHITSDELVDRVRARYGLA